MIKRLGTYVKLKGTPYKFRVAKNPGSSTVPYLLERVNKLGRKYPWGNCCATYYTLTTNYEKA